MAQLDLRNCFTYAYSAGTSADLFAACTAGALLTNYLDFDSTGLAPVGSSKPPYLVVKVGTAFAGNTGGAQIKLITDSVIPVFDAATAGDVMVHRFTMAQMAAGALLVNQALPHYDYLTFLALEFEPFTADASAGTI